MGTSIDKELLGRIKDDLALFLVPIVGGLSTTQVDARDRIESLRNIVTNLLIGATDVTMGLCSLAAGGTITIASGFSGIQHKLYGIAGSVYNASGTSNAQLVIFTGGNSNDALSWLYKGLARRQSEFPIELWMTHPVSCRPSEPLRGAVGTQFSGLIQLSVYYRPTKTNSEGLPPFV